MNRFTTLLAAGLLLVAGGACTSPAADAGTPGSAACPVGDPDCFEVGTEELDSEYVDAAHGLLGRSETDLPDDVRIGRRGSTSMALTEDHVIGRMTVELDDTDGSGFRVVTVVVELPNGSATVTLTPG